MEGATGLVVGACSLERNVSLDQLDNIDAITDLLYDRILCSSHPLICPTHRRFKRINVKDVVLGGADVNIVIW